MLRFVRQIDDDVRAVVGLDGGDALNRADDEVSEGVLIELRALAGHRRLGDAFQGLGVVGVDLCGDLVDLLAGVLARARLKPLMTAVG